MRAGEVVRIRVNPSDCMSTVDVLQKAGVDVKDMSFSQAVALAFSATLEVLRHAGSIPERFGNEYDEVMAPFANKGRTGAKLKVAAELYQQGSNFEFNQAADDPANTIETVFDPVAARIAELNEKKLTGNWTAEDESELRSIFAAL